MDLVFRILSRRADDLDAHRILGPMFCQYAPYDQVSEDLHFEASSQRAGDVFEGMEVLGSEVPQQCLKFLDEGDLACQALQGRGLNEAGVAGPRGLSLHFVLRVVGQEQVVADMHHFAGPHRPPCVRKAR